MSLYAVETRKRQLDEYFGRIADPDISDEVRSDLVRYGIVLVCGFVERSVETIIMERIAHRAHPRVQNFVRRYFKAGTNYNCEAIAQLLERFDVLWGDNFRESLRVRDNLSESLHSAYNLRNSIAHGGTANRGLRGVLELYTAAKEVVNAMELATT